MRVLPYAPLCALLSLHVAIGLLMPASAWAQSTGTVRGLVLDEAGAPLAGVTLALDSVSQGISGRGAVSDASGSFTIPALPPAGDYVLSAAIPGFATLTLTDIEVAAGRVATLKVTLQRQTEMRERVEVKARPQVVTLEETTTETRISAEFIDSLPILGRNYQDILTLAPGVTDVDGDGNPNIHGARDTDVITLVDGVSTSDPLTGKRGAELNIESIQEIEVKTSGALAEYGRAQGGFATILTKSGGNDFEGTMKFYWRGSLLDGDGAGADDPRLHAGLGESGLRDLRFNDYLPFLSVSGPIRRDHAWFFLSNEYIQQQDPVNALSNAFVTGIKEVREFAKITWQAGANHRLAFSLNYDPQQFLNQGLNSLTREESGYTLRQGGPMLTVKASSVMNPYVVLESLVSSFDERPSIEPTLDPDTNHNGILTYDRNGNGFNEASERDPGEDYDNDGKFDVFEDFNGNGRLDAGEDQDGDHRLTGPNSCEGDLREDVDCDGLLTEADDDRNGNNSIDDTPVPSDLYPYGELRPLPPDKEYSIDLRRGITSGPYYEEFRDRRRRFTLREDLSAYVPDYWGSHDLKFGFVLERENFDRDARARDVLSPFIRRNREGPSTIAAI
ncbi:MAG TPA: carboxypeptidase regulatory-like domain-containing protein, partial [Candidatus Polarisedimenticolia bacterium]|nr:carboxypeptidase regulatory-like domain-containing protein [Candidatus Polarisedimenticolia bacterium]